MMNKKAILLILIFLSIAVVGCAERWKGQEGTVGRIGPKTEEEVGDATAFPLIINLGEIGLDLRPGMTGRAEIGD